MEVFEVVGLYFTAWLLSFGELLTFSDSRPYTKRSFSQLLWLVGSELVSEICAQCQKEARAPRDLE